MKKFMKMKMMKMMKMKMMMIKMKVKMSMMRKVIDDDGYLVTEVILSRNLSQDESYLVMKVMLVKEVMTGEVSPVAMLVTNGTSLISQIGVETVAAFLRRKETSNSCKS